MVRPVTGIGQAPLEAMSELIRGLKRLCRTEMRGNIAPEPLAGRTAIFLTCKSAARYFPSATDGSHNVRAGM
jgi:hypothetical protein